jgi:hypothetical protein
VHADHPELGFAWTAIDRLDGRLLVVGPGCSRAYECADFPPGCVEEGVYFLDDRTYYNRTFPMETGPDEFAYTDNGRCCLMLPDVARSSRAPLPNEAGRRVFLNLLATGLDPTLMNDTATAKDY